MFRFWYILSFLVQAGKFLLLAGGGPPCQGMVIKEGSTAPQCRAGNSRLTASQPRSTPSNLGSLMLLVSSLSLRALHPIKFKRLYIFFFIYCARVLLQTRRKPPRWNFEEQKLPFSLNTSNLCPTSNQSAYFSLFLLMCSILCSLQILNSVHPHHPHHDHICQNTWSIAERPYT